jgi:P27 family predicted phage terminase small subunit
MQSSANGEDAESKGCSRKDSPGQTGEAQMARACAQAGIARSIDELDGAAFAGFCVTYARWRAAEEIVARDGMTVAGPDGRVKAHPCVRISTQASQLMLKFAQDFGMTPSSRSRIHVPLPTTKKSLRERLDDEFFPESS